jgi:phosphoserine phosphatase
MDPFLAILVDKGNLSEDANPPLRAYLKTLEGVDAEAIDIAPVVDNARLLLERWTNPEIPRNLRPSAKDMFYNIVAMMRGMTIAQAEAAAREVYSHGVGRYPPWRTRSFADKDGCSMRMLIARMKERGIEVYLLSATLDVLAREGGRVLGIPPERVLGSLLEVRDGKYTGQVRDSTYNAKGAIVRQWLSAPPLVAFGDSPNSDFPMLLEVAGASFMVNPRPEFLERDKNESGSRFVALWFDGTEQELAIQP